MKPNYHNFRILRFAIKYKGWHSYAKDRQTVNAINWGIRNDFLEVNEYRQFKLKR